MGATIQPLVFSFKLSPETQKGLDALEAEIKKIQSDSESIKGSESQVFQSLLDRLCSLISGLREDLFFAEGNAYSEATTTSED